MATNIPTVTLTGSVKMPVLGYGTWQSNDAELETALNVALEAGYRHIDTAHAYGNEKVIGNVLKEWFNAGKLKRDDVFVVTKLPPGGNYTEGVGKYLERSLKLLQVDYVDLYLVHTPFRFRDVEGDLHPHLPNGDMDFVSDVDHVAIWRAMEFELVEGRTRAIGLSNFNRQQIERILSKGANVVPHCLQIEVHPYLQQTDLIQYCRRHGIEVTAYSPLGTPGLSDFMERTFGKKIVDLPDILGNPVVIALAEKHNKTPAQIVLRYAIERNLTVIPKSSNAVRIRENLQIFDFELTSDDIEAMAKLDCNLRILDFSPFTGAKDQPEYPF